MEHGSYGCIGLYHRIATPRADCKATCRDTSDIASSYSHHDFNCCTLNHFKANDMKLIPKRRWASTEDS